MRISGYRKQLLSGRFIPSYGVLKLAQDACMHRSYFQSISQHDALAPAWLLHGRWPPHFPYGGVAEGL